MNLMSNLIFQSHIRQLRLKLPCLNWTAKLQKCTGRICLSDHFKPLWARNVPKFGIAQAFSLGLGPWLAVEVPDLVARGVIQPKAA
ncbi:unnamed protein product [Gongylonema pulchrum]|uniref:Ubiquitin-fold modifier-conjugating enzyme 1 n=1 Tax=Gongylonema pulchrum TaxID=637853 RepID=A0A183DRL4_9BILA|nr:unnamed protein product [Gongylonema pulchrum]